MRVLFWIVAVFAVGAGLVVAARYNTGYVLVVAPPYRIELSLNLLILLLIAAYALFYGFVRIIVSAVQLPSRVRAYSAARRQRREHDALLEALREWLAARYAKAEQAAAAIVLPEYVGLAAVIAAKAAHELHAYERRDAHIAKAHSLAPQEETIRVISEAQFLLDEQRAREALDALRLLPQKHTAALRLEFRVQVALRDWEQVLPLISQLEKRNVLDAVQAQHWRRRATSETLRRKTDDLGTLTEAWKKVPDALRRDPHVAAAAAQAYLAVGDAAGAQRILEGGLAQNWSEPLIRLYGECAGDTVRQIERAEAWLGDHPRDAALLLALARLCARQGLWGKAQNYIEASISVEATPEAHLEAAKLDERFGSSELACRHYQESLDLAMARLRELQQARPQRDEGFPAPGGAPQALNRLSVVEPREAPQE